MEYIISDEDRYLLEAILPYFEHNAPINVSNCLYRGLKARGDDTEKYKLYDKSRAIAEFLIKYEFAEGSKLDPVITRKGKALKECGSLSVFEDKNKPKVKKELFGIKGGKNKTAEEPAPHKEQEKEAEKERQPRKALEIPKLFNLLRKSSSKPAPEPVPAPIADEIMPLPVIRPFVRPSVSTAAAHVPYGQNTEPEHVAQPQESLPVSPAPSAGVPVAVAPPIEAKPVPVKEEPIKEPAMAPASASVKEELVVADSPKVKGVKDVPMAVAADTVQLNKKVNLLYGLYFVSLLIACLSVYLLLLEHKKHISDNAAMIQAMDARFKADKKETDRRIDSMYRAVKTGLEAATPEPAEKRPAAHVH